MKVEKIYVGSDKKSKKEVFRAIISGYLRSENWVVLIGKIKENGQLEKVYEGYCSTLFHAERALHDYRNGVIWKKISE